MRAFRWLFIGLLVTSPARSQDAGATQTVLDRSFWVSPRALGMAGAISPIAEGIDAPYYNPAGIGGLQPKKYGHWIRALDFPYFGAGMNDNARALYDELGQSGFGADAAISEAAFAANENKRQYLRASFVPKFGIGRALIAYHHDIQMAAMNTGAPDNLIDTHYRVTSGPGMGFSATNKEQTFLLGLYGFFGSRKDTAGEFDWADINDPERRKTTLDDNSTTYSGFVKQMGVSWRLGKTALPTLSIVARDVGNTEWKAVKGDGESYVEMEEKIIGFSLTPQLGKWGYLNWVVEAGGLGNSDVAMTKKFRSGLELTFGERYGSDAFFALRAGANAAGASYGMGFNVGLLNIQAANYAEDVGIANKRVIERRTVGIIRINVGEF